MPTYQYVCTECGSDLEAVQSFSDPSLTDCPTCGGKLRKRFGAVGVVFKGSGFYRTDSRGGSGEPKTDSGDKPSKPETKGDSKTETKADSSKSEKSASGDSGQSAKPKSDSAAAKTTTAA